MRRLLGQATIASAIVSHRILSTLFGLLLLFLLLVGGLTWRLTQGPIDLGFLIPRIEGLVNQDGAPTRMSIGGVALAWEGLHKGLDRPIDLRLRDVALTDQSGRKRLIVPSTAVVLSARGLLQGRLLPSAIDLSGVRLTLLRAADGSVGADMGSLSEMIDTSSGDPTAGAAPAAESGSMGASMPASLAELMRPLGDDTTGEGHVLSLLRRVRLSDFALTVRDEAIGATWSVPHLDLDLTRRRGGGVDLAGQADVALGGQTVHATVSAVSSVNRERIEVRVSLSPVIPAALARAAPGLADLSAVDAPVTAQAVLSLSSTLEPGAGSLSLTLGGGKLIIGPGEAPLRSAEVSLIGTWPRGLNGTVRMVLPGGAGQPDPVLSAAVTVAPPAPRRTIGLSLGLDRVAFADLPTLWPLGLAPGARQWVLGNIPAGMAHDGHFDLTLETAADFSDLTLTKATGELEGDDVTVHWLRPVPPVEQARAHLRLIDPDTIDIAFLAGRQRVGTRLPIVVNGGTMRVTGLTVKDQDADITARVTGSLADTIAIMREPRLKLLSAHPMDLRDPAGEASIAAHVKLPLESKLDIEDVTIGVTAQLKQGHLSAIAAGRDLDRADLEIVADTKGLTLKGTGFIGGIASKIDGMMDFQAGRAKDVQQRITVTAAPSAGQLAAAGLAVGDVLAGSFPAQVVWSKRGDGDGDIMLTADLTPAVLTLAPLAWSKAAGVTASATARLVLTKDRLTSIGPIVVDGTDLSVRATAEVTGADVSGLRLDRVVLGKTVLSGGVRMPPGGPIAVEIDAQVFDAADKLAEKTPPRDVSKPEPKPGPAWTLNGTFGRVLLARGKVATGVKARASNDGRVFRALTVSGQTGPNAPFTLAIGMDRDTRRLEVRAADAGALLNGLDVTHSLEDGTLRLDGIFDDSTPAHALKGSAEILEFRVHGMPALGKLLQAMTLYGLVDVIRGPGLGFARLTAPFVFADNVLTLADTMAFSPSLGMTAKGRIDLGSETIDLEGTVVPAYFFNSLLGRIPFVGGLFSAEKGGGLFAARYTLRGPTGDPAVFVNPLSILTPGFLRGVFGIF